MRRRVLFVSEAVSIAHVARPSVLADSLNGDRFDVHFASSGEYSFCHQDRHWTFHRLASLSPQAFLRRLARGHPVHGRDDIARCVDDDLQLLKSVQPDCIVHDFRLSMAISARLAGIPLLSICNAHWSPFAQRAPMLAPDLPILRHIGAGLRDAGFRATWPVANRIHVAAVNAVRRRYGLARYGSVFEYYCDGDQVLYADAAELTPTRGAPDSHVFLGPLIWSPQGCQPDWWGDEQAKGQDARRAYITLGSTGQVDLLPNIIGACRAAGLDCLIATAGRKGIASDAPAIRVADYLPGSEAAALASIVVCNGGSATAHQALAQGVPVLGICSNLDQILTMQSIERAGAGLLLRAGDADSKKLGRAVRAIVSSPEFGRAAHRIQGWFDRLDAPRRFCEVIAGGSADLGRAP